MDNTNAPTSYRTPIAKLDIEEDINNVIAVTRFNIETYREYRNFISEYSPPSLNTEPDKQSTSETSETSEVSEVSEVPKKQKIHKNVPRSVSQMYNTPVIISGEQSKLYTKDYIFVIEMMNPENEIIGISIVKNRPYYRMFPMYTDKNYNRYSYRIIHRLSREMVESHIEGKYLLSCLEKLVFTGKNHLKRGNGIQYIKTQYYKKMEQKNDEISTNNDIQEATPLSIETSYLTIMRNMFMREQVQVQAHTLSISNYNDKFTE